MRFGDKEIEKEKFYAAKRSMKIWDVNVDNTAISKLVETKTDSKYLIGYLDKAIRPLIWMCLKRVVKTFKDKEGKNKLMPFRRDNEKLLEKYKAIWTKIEDLKSNAAPVYDKT